ncbi:MAG: alpha/beta fold hydrolase, partial [Thermoleophilia bacterium]
AKRLAEYRATVPGTETKLISGAGHSPNVEKPAETAALLLGFAPAAKPIDKPNRRPALQKPMQAHPAVRKHP